MQVFGQYLHPHFRHLPLQVGQADQRGIGRARQPQPPREAAAHGFQPGGKGQQLVQEVTEGTVGTVLQQGVAADGGRGFGQGGTWGGGARDR